MLLSHKLPALSGVGRTGKAGGCLARRIELLEHIDECGSDCLGPPSAWG